MIDIKSRVHCDAAMAKVTTAEAAAALIKDGMNIGVSGFTPSGYPKAVPLALAERAKTDPLKINLWTGASVGPEIDSALTNAGVVARRLPYQTNNDLRKAINNGSVKYTDLHLSHVAQMARYGFMYGNNDVDIAIIEACIIKDLGNGQIGIVPTTSMGNSSSFVQSAKQVIIEVNTTQPEALEGMHDSYVPLDPPNRKAIPVERPEDRIGTTYIPCDLSKVAAIVPCDIT
ncbi:MAG: acetyl-CoA hydrolase, partial [Acidaminococcaceae bacterium]